MAINGGQVATGAVGGAAAGSAFGPIGTAIGAVVGAIGGVLGSIFANQGHAAQIKLLQQALDETGKINIPKLQRLIAYQMPPTELAKIALDPSWKEASQSAMAALQQRADAGGLTLADKKALNDVIAVANQNTASQNARVKEDFSRRGGFNQNQELLSSLVNNSAATKAANDAAQTTAANAQKYGYQAVLDKASLGMKSNQQEYDQAYNKAHAQDVINQYNTTQKTEADKYNNTLSQWETERELEKQRMRNETLGLMGGAKVTQGNTKAGTVGSIATDASRVIGAAGQLFGGGSNPSLGADSTGTYTPGASSTDTAPISPGTLELDPELADWMRRNPGATY